MLTLPVKLFNKMLSLTIVSALLNVVPTWAKETVPAKPPNNKKDEVKLTADFLEFLAHSQIDDKKIIFPNDLHDIDEQMLDDAIANEKKASVDVNQTTKKTLNMNSSDKKNRNSNTKGDK